MGKYIQQSDIENAMGVQFVIGCFDDNNDGTADVGPVNSVISRAEGILDAFLATEVSLPIPTPTDRLVVEAALEYAITFAMDRRPEYARRFGDDGAQGRDSHYRRARQLCGDIKAAQIVLPDNQSVEPAGNTGSILYDHSHRMMIDSADGRGNGGDF